MKKNTDRKELIITALLLIAIVLIIMFVVSLVGGAIMKLFGFEYNSLVSLFLFFLIPTLVCFPISNIIEVLPKVLYFEFSVISKMQAMIIYVVLDTLVSMFAYAVTDYFMESVRAGDAAIFVVSLVFALLGMKDVVTREDDMTEEEKRKS